MVFPLGEWISWARSAGRCPVPQLSAASRE